MTSPNTTLTEKLEFLYYTPYYIQGLFFCIGTTAWMIQLWTGSYLPFWTALFGWGLLLSNSFAIPLMNFAGLVSEGPRRRDVTGVMSAVVLSYVVAFFQGYAALRGFLEPKEGGWVRTFKSGKITHAPVKITPKTTTLQPVSARKPKPARRRVIALPVQIRRTPAITVIVLVLAGLLATNLFLATSVQNVEALPANMIWYPTNTQGLQTRQDASSVELTLTHASRMWSTSPTQYSLSRSDAVEGWLFHLVCTFATQTPNYNVTVNLYYSHDSGSENLLESGQASLRSLNCDGTNENLIPLAPATWAGRPGTYDLNLEVFTSNPGAYLVIVTGGTHASSLSDGNSVPECVLPLIGLVPLIPIVIRRRRKK
jgi:hypothetical protein